MFAATPTTPITNSGQNPNSAPAKKSHKKLIIALAAGIGGILLIGAAFFLLVNNNKIHNLAEFKFAMKNHKAINCQYVIDDGMFRPEHMLLQTNDGWSKAHAKLSGGFTVEAWYVANGAKMTAYTTLSNGGKSASIKQDGKMSDLEDSVSPNDDDMGAIKDLKCDANYKADFAVPNRDWKPENDAKLTIDSDKSDDSNSDDGSDDDAAADGARQHDAEKIQGALLAYATDNRGAWPTNECLTTDFSPQGESSCFGSYVGFTDEIMKIVPGDKSLAVGNTAAIQLGADCKGTPDAESAAVYVAQEIYEPRSPYCLDSTSGADYLH